MKIRTDFVTNSSSSSFVVEIDFELKNGETVSFCGNGATEETGVIDYFEGEAIIKVSPRELGTAENVEELISLLTDEVVTEVFDEDSCDFVNKKIFECHRQIQSDCGMGSHDPYDFIEEIRSKIKTMDDIESVSISGNEYNYCDYLRTFTYKREADEYTCEIEGEEFEIDGSSGGHLYFRDDFLAKGYQILIDEEGNEREIEYNPYSYGRTLNLADLPIVVPIEGTGYEGRNERLEHVKAGDKLILKMDLKNKFYTPVAIEVFNVKNETLGYLSETWEYPLTNIARIINESEAYVDSITPLSARSKRAKYALMDVRIVPKG